MNQSNLAYHFSTDRYKEFCKETLFLLTELGQIQVNYQMIHNKSAKEVNGDLLKFSVPDQEDYVHGKPFSEELIDIVTRDKWRIEEVGDFLKKYLCILPSFEQLEGFNHEPDLIDEPLSGEYFDIIPQNIILKEDNKWGFIDKEWVYKFDITVGFLIFRTLLSLLNTTTRINSSATDIVGSPFVFIYSAFKTLGFDISEEKIKSYANLELAVQAEVSPRPLDKKSFFTWLFTTPFTSQSLNQSYSHLRENFEELQALRDKERHEMLLLSDWAQYIEKHPFQYGLKKHLRAIARAGFHSLPISPSAKQRLKNKAKHIFSSIKSTKSQSQDFNISSPALLELVNGDVVKGRDIFVFSVIDWDFRFQRPQHLARSLAKYGKRVFFFCNHFIDSAKPGYKLEVLDPSLELYQVKLHVKGAPAIYFAPPTDEAMAMIQDGIARLMMDFAAVSSVSLVQHAYWYPLVALLPNTMKVYDCMDHHEGFGNVPEKLIEIEKSMLCDSDLVVVTSGWLEEYAHEHNSNVAVIRNAAEYAHFSEPPAEHYVDPHGRKIIGYYGAIAEWFDLDLVRTVAKANPQALVLLIGNDTINGAKMLKDLPNVEFTGEVPYGRLPYYLYAFDLCMLPFKIMPLTLATNPVKVYEYLAAGKPVISVDLPEISQFGELVQCARTNGEFVQMVSDCISEPENSLRPISGGSSRRNRLGITARRFYPVQFKTCPCQRLAWWC